MSWSGVAIRTLGALMVLMGLPMVAQESTPWQDRLAPLVAKDMKEQGAWAGSLTVVKDGKLLFGSGFGSLLPESELRVDSTVVFRWASCTKPLVDAMVHGLVAEGRCRLEDRPFQVWRAKGVVPKSVPPDYDTITVAHLLTHAGGWDRAKSSDPVFGFPGLEKFNVHPAHVYPWEMIQIVAQRKLDFPPGTASAYSNFGYVVLARVIEDAMRKRFNECVRDFWHSALGDDGFDVAGYASERRLVQPSYACDDSYPVMLGDGCCGILASSDSMCRYLDRSYKSRKGGANLPGVWAFYGSTPGSLSMIVKRLDGISYAYVINSRVRALDEFQKRLDDALDRELLGRINATENRSVMGAWNFKDGPASFTLTFDGDLALNSDGNGGPYRVDGKTLSLKWRGQPMYDFKADASGGYQGVSPTGASIRLRRR